MIRNIIWTMVSIAVLHFFIFSLTAYANGTSAEKRIIVVLRYDDYSTTSSTDLEIKIIDALQEKSVSCTFGVIPYPHGLGNALTQIKANILNKAIQAGTLEVALHGFDHISIRKDRKSEFFGLDFSSQVEKIAKGKEFLEKMLDTEVTTFIPPFNNYDLNTIRALEKLEFKNLSANVLGVAEGSSSLNFLPTTCGLHDLREAVESARHTPEIQSVIIVMFHPYDFLDVDRERGKLSYQEFVELLSWLTSQKDIDIGSINKATTNIEDLSSRRYLNSRSYFQLYILMPTVLKRLFHIPLGVYLCPTSSSNIKSVLGPLVAVFYLGILVISTAIAFCGASIALPRSRLVILLSMYAGPVLLVLCATYALRDSVFGMKAASGMSVGLGAYIGVWLSYLRFRKQTRLKQIT